MPVGVMRTALLCMAIAFGLLWPANVHAQRGADMRTVANLQRQANRLQQAGRFRQAARTYQRVTILLKKLRPRSIELASALNNLGTMYNELGDWKGAEENLLAADDLKKAIKGHNDESRIGTIANLASLYHSIGQLNRAEAAYREALKLAEKHHGKDGLKVGMVLTGFGHFQQEQRKYDEAEPMLKRALAIFDKKVGKNSPHTATVLSNLALLAMKRGQHARSIELYERVIALRERLLGHDHPDLVGALQELADVYAAKGEHARAETMLRRALDISKSRDASEDQRAYVQLALVRLFMRQNKVDAASKLLVEASEVREKSIIAMLGRGFFMRGNAGEVAHQFSGDVDVPITLHLRKASRHQGAANAAATTILRTKGRALDTMTRWGAVRDSTSDDDRALWKRLANARAELGEALYARMKQWHTMHEYQTGHALRRANEAVRKRADELTPATPATLAAVRRNIPEGAAVIDYAPWSELKLTEKADVSVRGTIRYAAYVYGRDGDIRAVDLGPADAVRKGVDALRGQLRDPQSDPKLAARALDKLVMEPVVPLLGKRKLALVSPAGALSLVPFGALVDERGRYRIETLDIGYLTNTRDLLRQPSRIGDTSGEDLILAAPEYGVASEDAGENPWGLHRVSFGPLSGTRQEGKAIAKLLPDARIALGDDASEHVLRSAGSPRILHIATHGYFVAVIDEGKKGERALMLTGGAAEQGAGSSPEATTFKSYRKPFGSMYATGLAFAGANARKSGDDDGWLSASELASLDLSGTKLAVLSACDSGSGFHSISEGVHGLRRALSLAGAETQVVSLWKVDDDATRDLMVDFYRRLVKGAPRGGALVDAQRAMLARPEYAHPYYWAAFISSGAWGPLVETAEAPEAKTSVTPPKTEPSARGCACNVPGAPPDELPWFAALALVATAARRRISSM